MKINAMRSSQGGKFEDSFSPLGGEFDRVNSNFFNSAGGLPVLRTLVETTDKCIIITVKPKMPEKLCLNLSSF